MFRSSNRRRFFNAIAAFFAAILLQQQIASIPGVYGLSQELAEILDDVTANFQENLKRAFTNEGVRIDRMSKMTPSSPLARKRTSKEIRLDDVILTNEGTQIELRNLRLKGRPDFRVSRLDINIETFTLDWALNLDTLRVEGDYSAKNVSLQRLLPVTDTGKINFELEKVRAEGIVGLYVREDSFCVENLDMKYKPSRVIVKVEHEENGQRVENQASEIDIGQSLAGAFWPELTEKIDKELYKQLGAVIVEYSVNEMLVDQDEEIKNLSNERAKIANAIVDSVLSSAKGKIVTSNSGLITVEGLSKSFHKFPPGEGTGALETGEGNARDLSSLTRQRDFSLTKDKGRNRWFVFGSLSLKDFKITYDKMQWWWKDMSSTGKIVCTSYKNKVFLKLSVDYSTQGHTDVNLEQVQIKTFDEVEVEVYELGSLSWAKDRIKAWIIGHARARIIPSVEKSIANAVKEAILLYANTDANTNANTSTNSKNEKINLPTIH